ncbi:hypothetical protein BH09MYX1_BH09MYX1_61200 [soil metagenome]
MVRFRALASALGLFAFACLHAYVAVSYWRAGLEVLSLPIVVYFAGCLATAYGLAFRRSWARMMAIGIAVAALSQLSSGVVVVAFTGWMPLSWTSGCVQFALNMALLLGTSGKRMRAAFEEAAGSGWTLDLPLVRLARTALIAGIAAVPMLFSMAAAAAYASPLSRVVASVGGVLMFVAQLLVLRRKSAGLLLLLFASITSAVGVVGTFATLDRNPALAGNDWYFSCTVIDGVSALSGVVLGLGLFIAFVPRFRTFLSTSSRLPVDRAEHA